MKGDLALMKLLSEGLVEKIHMRFTNDRQVALGKL
jgi:hypothetical protein